MKSKLNDADLIAEAYSNVEPLEVQEEMLGALAAGAGAAARGVGQAARATGKALTSNTAKKIYKGAGKAVKKTAETVGGAALGAVGGAAEGAAKAVGGVVQGAVEGTVGAVQGAVDGATGGLGKAAKGAVGMEDGEGEHDAPMRNVTKRTLSREELQAKIQKAEEYTTKLQARVNASRERGDIDSSDAASIMHMHNNTSEDAEHAAPEEVDMSQNPAPESLEVSKEVEEPETSVAIVAPSIQPSVEAERINHADDSEVKMALSELYKIEKYAFALGLMMKETNALEGWTAAKITKAADYLGSVFHKLDYDFHADAEDHGDITAEDHESH